MKHLRREQIVLILLLIFYTVGFVGLIQPDYKAYFLSLTPFNLLLTLGLFLWANQDIKKRGLLCFALVFSLGWCIEWLGVHTGLLFGQYTYGRSLGFALDGIPLIIGVNWLILVLASRVVAMSLVSKPFHQHLLAASLMTALDVWIEPVAIKLDFWQWSKGEIPLQNYLMWFLTALFMQVIIAKFAPKISREAGFFVLLVQFLFFTLLNLCL
jgi:putative membrane protein